MKMNRSMLRVEELERRENPAAIGIGLPNEALMPSPPEAMFREGYTGNLENDQGYTGNLENDVRLLPQPPNLNYQGPDIVIGASGTGSSLVRTFSSSGTQRLSFNAFESTFTGGITPAGSQSPPQISISTASKTSSSVPASAAARG